MSREDPTPAEAKRMLCALALSALAVFAVMALVALVVRLDSAHDARVFRKESAALRGLVVRVQRAVGTEGTRRFPTIARDAAGNVPVEQLVQRATGMQNVFTDTPRDAQRPEMLVILRDSTASRLHLRLVKKHGRYLEVTFGPTGAATVTETNGTEPGVVEDDSSTAV